MVILWREARFILKQGFEIAVPLTIWEEGGKTDIRVWPRLAPLARRCERRYRDNLFSDEAIAYLMAGASVYLAKKGYTVDPVVERREHILYSDGKERAIPKGIEAVPLSEEIIAENENLTEYDLPTTLAAGVVAYVVIDGGKIVSIASTNEPMEEGEVTEMEIGVETHPDHQGKGYGTACVTALTNRLLERKIHTKVHIEYDNTSSLRLFEKAGYTHAGRVMYIVGERR